jgi:hypothetical protein
MIKKIGKGSLDTGSFDNPDNGISINEKIFKIQKKNTNILLNL